MTIYKTEKGDATEKKDLIDDGADVEVVVSETKCLKHDGPLDIEVSVYNDPVVPIRRNKQSRRRLVIQVCLLFGMLTGLAISILSSLYLYRSMHLRGRWVCGVSYRDTAENQSLLSNVMPGAAAYSGKSTFEEEIEINDKMETIHVPKSGKYDEATFKHDFSHNVTALMDIQAHVCLLLPLLYPVLVDPETFYYDLQKHEEGELFDPMYERTHEYFAKQYLPSDYDDDWLRELCGDYTPYHGTEHALTTTTSTTASPDSEDMYEKFFHMFAGGDSIISYHVIFYHGGDSDHK